jgi:hypothetical protein
LMSMAEVASIMRVRASLSLSSPPARHALQEWYPVLAAAFEGRVAVPAVRGWRVHGQGCAPSPLGTWDPRAGLH